MTESKTEQKESNWTKMVSWMNGTKKRYIVQKMVENIVICRQKNQNDQNRRENFVSSWWENVQMIKKGRLNDRERIVS